MLGSKTKKEESVNSPRYGENGLVKWLGEIAGQILIMLRDRTNRGFLGEGIYNLPFC